MSSSIKIFLFHGSTEAVEFVQTKLTPFGNVYVEKFEVSILCDKITLGICIRLLDFD